MAEEKPANGAKYVITDVQGVAIGANAAVIAFEKTERRELRKWWHEILRTYGRYVCYAMFLVLPSDREAIRYLTEYGKELDVISGKNCLVIALSENAFKLSKFDEGLWKIFVEEHSGEGYSVRVAQLFGVSLTELPCLLVFRDIRSSDHTTITLKGLALEELAGKMRAIFATIQKSVSEHKDPLAAIQSYQTGESFKKTSRKVANEIGGFVEKTFEAAIEAWIGATIK